MLFCWHKYEIIGSQRIDKFTKLDAFGIETYKGPGTMLLKLCRKCGETKNEAVYGHFDLGKKEEKSAPGT